MLDRTVKNSVQFLSMNGFQIDCVGDQQDVADFLNAQTEVEDSETEDVDLRHSKLRCTLNNLLI